MKHIPIISNPSQIRIIPEGVTKEQIMTQWPPALQRLSMEADLGSAHLLQEVEFWFNFYSALQLDGVTVHSDAREAIMALHEHVLRAHRGAATLQSKVRQLMLRKGLV